MSEAAVYLSGKEASVYTSYVYVFCLMSEAAIYLSGKEASVYTSYVYVFCLMSEAFVYLSGKEASVCTSYVYVFCLMSEAVVYLSEKEAAVCTSYVSYCDHSSSVVRPSVRPSTHLNDFSSETPGPNFFKLNVEPSGKGGLKICTNGHGP